MKDAARRGISPIAPLKALLFASVLVPALVFAVAAYEKYNDVFRAAEERARHISHVLEEHALKSLETIELALRATDLRLRDVDWETIRTSRALWEELRDLQQQSDQVGSIFVIDPDGRNPLTTRAFPAPDTSFADRDYFYEQRSADQGVYVSNRYVGKISGEPIFNLSIRRTSADGRFNGVIGSSAFVDYLEKFYATAGVAEDRFAIGLVRDDGAILARYPARTAAHPVPARDVRETLADHRSDVFLARSPVDGVERLYSIKKVKNFPLSVIYGIERGTILATWYRYVVWWGVLAACVAAGLFAVSWLALRRAQETAAALQRWENTAAELRRESERRTQAESTLIQAQKQEAIGQLTGGIAHDFNNLLAVILSNLALLKKRLKTDERGTRLVDDAIQGAERGVGLTQRLLAFARRQELSPRAVDVPGLIAGMGDLLRRSLGPEFQIAMDFPPRLPAARADRNQLELAVLNLLINARDAMPLGGRIVISAREMATADGLDGGPYVCIRIVDSGTGMDEATLARATEPFFTTKGVGKGTGLGLSMVHGFATQSGGQLRLSSRLGAGTTAEIVLPSTGQPAASEPAPARPALGMLSPRNILIVDDDALVRAGTVAMLEDLGHTVVEAPSGQRALDILGATSVFDAVITDQSMPGMTGLELARRIRERWPAMPIILATGHGELPQRPDLALPVLSKPFDQRDLTAALAALRDGGGPSNVVRLH